MTQEEGLKKVIECTDFENCLNFTFLDEDWSANLSTKTVSFQADAYNCVSNEYALDERTWATVLPAQRFISPIFTPWGGLLGLFSTSNHRGRCLLYLVNGSTWLQRTFLDGTIIFFNTECQKVSCILIFQYTHYSIIVKLVYECIRSVMYILLCTIIINDLDLAYDHQRLIHVGIKLESDFGSAGNIEFPIRYSPTLKSLRVWQSIGYRRIRSFRTATRATMIHIKPECSSRRYVCNVRAVSIGISIDIRCTSWYRAGLYLYVYVGM